MNLTNKTILITRPEDQSCEFVDELAKRGARSLVVPFIQIGEPDSWEECDAAIATLHEFHGIIFASRNGVQGFFTRLRTRRGDIAAVAHCKVYAIGSKTAAVLKEQGASVDVVPNEFSAASLLKYFDGCDVKGMKYLCPRGNVGRDELISGLKSRGAEVVAPEVYKNSMPDQDDLEWLRNTLWQGDIDVITFASPSAVKAFSSFIATKELYEKSSSVRIAVIGPTTRDAAEDEGYNVDIVAREATVLGLVNSISQYYGNIS